MRVKYKDSLECKAVAHLNRMRSNIVLRRDFDRLGGSYSQTTRIFKKFITEKRIVRLGVGIYAKAYASQYTDKPLIKGGIDSAFNETLKKLGVSFDSGTAEKEYNSGLTTQIPARKVIRLKSRFRRQIAYGKAHLIFEKNINAK